MKIIIVIIAVIAANLFGHATWILALANFAWLLFKDVALFSWWWVGFAAVGFIISCVMFLGAYLSAIRD